MLHQGVLTKQYRENSLKQHREGKERAVLRLALGHFASSRSVRMTADRQADASDSSLRHARQGFAEPALGIGPGLLQPQTAALEKRRNRCCSELITVFRVDALTVGEIETTAQVLHPYRLLAVTFQMHFDARGLRVPACNVAGSLTMSNPARSASPGANDRRNSTRNWQASSGSKFPMVEPKNSVSFRPGKSLS